MIVFHARSVFATFLAVCLCVSTTQAKKYDLSYPSMLSAYYHDPSDEDPVIQGPLIIRDEREGGDAVIELLLNKNSPVTLFSAQDIHKTLGLRSAVLLAKQASVVAIADTAQFFQEDILKLLHASLRDGVKVVPDDPYLVGFCFTQSFLQLLKLFNTNVVRKIRANHDLAVFDSIASSFPSLADYEQAVRDEAAKPCDPAILRGKFTQLLEQDDAVEMFARFTLTQYNMVSITATRWWGREYLGGLTFRPHGNAPKPEVFTAEASKQVLGNLFHLYTFYTYFSEGALDLSRDPKENVVLKVLEQAIYRFAGRILEVGREWEWVAAALTPLVSTVTPAESAVAAAAAA